MPTQTYWLEPNGPVALGLRRYSHSHVGYSCAEGWHEAVAWTGRDIARFTTLGDGKVLAAAEPLPDDDPRWPVECEQGCGYRFTEPDHRQRWQELLYIRPADKKLFSLHWKSVPPGCEKAGPGASYDAWWYPDGWRGADGISLIVLCPRPDGSPGPAWDWCVDMPSSTGGRWTRSGDPRAACVTASPSIAIGDPAKPGHYHGFLQSGVLTDHLG